MTPGLASLARTLGETLHLTLPPIAITLTDEPPAGVPAFSGSAPAGCSFWEKAASGAFVTSPADHDACAIGTYTHNLEGTPAHEKDRGDALKIFADLGYFPPSELPRLPVLKERKQHVVYSPLADATIAPDVVMLFVKANQSLILSEAVSSVDGDIPPAMGRPACAVIPQAMNSGHAALSLGCCGARAYLDALTDDVALFALPGAKLEAYVTRIVELAKANGILSAFHQLRRKQIEGGAHPTVMESLAALQAGG